MSTSTVSRYDCIVIGSGQAGTPLCQALAGAGMRTAIVEREHVGGTCINDYGGQRAGGLPCAAWRGLWRTYWRTWN
jgi:cation diffusion facilitator CzcD-associated flavoprotein CzcO